MNKVKLRLLEKEKLTHDVFDLKFRVDSDVPVEAGQFCTFVIRNAEGKKMRKAYSIANKSWDILSFIIKRLENGQGWSKAICDLEIGAEVDGIYPLWTFTLQDEDNAKMFIWTGTGFAPLYFQILKALERGDKSLHKFVFGVRNEIDVFYEDILNELSEKFSNFSYEIFLSRDDSQKHSKGYVTDRIDEETVSDYSEFYICGSPNMVTDAKERLSNLNAQNIYSEEY